MMKEKLTKYKKWKKKCWQQKSKIEIEASYHSTKMRNEMETLRFNLTWTQMRDFSWKPGNEGKNYFIKLNVD